MTAETITAPEGVEAFMSQAEVAAWLRVSVRTIIDIVRAGHLQPIYIGTRPIYPMSELNRFVEMKKNEANPRRHGSNAGRRNARREAARNVNADQGSVKADTGNGGNEDNREKAE
jgi:hypothetical protein